MLKIKEIPYLHNSKEFEFFIKSPSNFANFLQVFYGFLVIILIFFMKELKPFEVQTIDDLVVKYQRTFEELSGVRRILT